MKTETETPTRVKIGVNSNLRDRLRDEAYTFAVTCNEDILPTLTDLEIPANKQNIFELAAMTEEELREHYIELQLAAATDINSKLMRKVAAKVAGDQFDEITHGHRFTTARTAHPEFISMTADRVTYSSPAIEEAATIYAEGETLEAYNRHVAAVNALNEFFKGHAPEPSALRTYFPIVDGKVQVGFSPAINYKNFQ